MKSAIGRKDLYYQFQIDSIACIRGGLVESTCYVMFNLYVWPNTKD